MPELPEVEIVCKGLIPAMMSRKIVKIVQNRKNLRIDFPEDFSNRVKGSKVINVRRRAKYVLIELDNNQIIVIHLGMSGVLKVIPCDDEYKPVKHDHMIIILDDGGKVVLNDPRRFGLVMLLNNEELEVHKSFSSMGPEPFSNEFNSAYLYESLQKRQGVIKSALLDQSLVAGLGNIYVCEVLYQCGISPKRISNKVTIDECNLLVISIRDILNKAIKAGGSSLKDYRHTDGDLGYFQHQFAVYGKEGEKCPECDCNFSIKKINQSGRSSFYCSKRQK